MSGSEYEFGTHVPYIPKLKVFGKKFSWDAGTAASWCQGPFYMEMGLEY